MLEERRVLSTWTVTSIYDGGNGTLRDDIALAQPGDTIVFDPSLDHQTITLGIQELEINKNLTIQGPGASLLAISGNNQSRVFQVDAGTNVTISGLAIEGGIGEASSAKDANGDNVPDQYDGYGGGILNLGTLALSGCTVTGNITRAGLGIGGAFGYQFEGGGIYNHGTLTLSDGCIVTGNVAPDQYLNSSRTILKGAGGGIFNDSQGSLTILSSTVINNTATIGADIDSLGLMTISKDSKVGHISNKL
jgi:hypothetical protein